MKLKKLYIYNPETDDFERYYPSFKERIWKISKLSISVLLLTLILFLLIFYIFDSPTEENLRIENSILSSQYRILEKRMEASEKVIESLRQRDDNFYRVMMQMEPMTEFERFSGLDNDNRYAGLQKLNDARLITGLTQQLDFLDRQIVAQSQSYDELRDTLLNRREKLAHIPSILPLNTPHYALSSGYGRRLDPVYNVSDFHEGIDFSAPVGTPVYATAAGEIKQANFSRKHGYEVVISHGYNYETRYASLRNTIMKEGENVKRGQLIGYVGNTGKSLGPHLHYEVLFKGEPQNPVDYYFMDLTPAQYKEMLKQADNAGFVMD